MGSLSRYSAMDRFIEKNKANLLKKYEKLLLGRKIIELESIEAEYHIKGIVVLDNKDRYEVHYRWTSMEEDQTGQESTGQDEDIIPMGQYYEDYILKKEIVKVTIGYERDDVVYCYGIVDKEADIAIEIPIVYADYTEDYEEEL